MKCLSNLKKNSKNLALKAIAESGDVIEWRDKPDARMANIEDAADYGSIWSNQADCRRFWKLFTESYNRLNSVECNR